MGKTIIAGSWSIIILTSTLCCMDMDMDLTMISEVMPLHKEPAREKRTTIKVYPLSDHGPGVLSLSIPKRGETVKTLKELLILENIELFYQGNMKPLSDETKVSSLGGEHDWVTLKIPLLHEGEPGTQRTLRTQGLLFYSYKHKK